MMFINAMIEGTNAPAMQSNGLTAQVHYNKQFPTVNIWKSHEKV